MADRLVKIGMDTGASNEVLATSGSDHGTVREATAFLCNNVNYWPEASRTDQHVIQDPALTLRDLKISSSTG